MTGSKDRTGVSRAGSYVRIRLMKLILASNSPRRKELLALGGWPFDVRPAEIDEQVLPGEPPREYVLRLAEEKARAVARMLPAADLPTAIIIAADTTVALEDLPAPEILAKPEDAADAETMLRRLRDRTHMVYTALAILRPAEDLLLKDLCATGVHMRLYTDQEMQEYIQSGDPLDKAGAYAIQHAGFHPVDRLEGCYNNVVGLPLCRLTQMLTGLGWPPPARPPYPCLYQLTDACSFTPPLVEAEG